MMEVLSDILFYLPCDVLYEPGYPYNMVLRTEECTVEPV